MVLEKHRRKQLAKVTRARSLSDKILYQGVAKKHELSLPPPKITLLNSQNHALERGKRKYASNKEVQTIRAEEIRLKKMELKEKAATYYDAHKQKLELMQNTKNDKTDDKKKR